MKIDAILDSCIIDVTVHHPEPGIMYAVEIAAVIDGVEHTLQSKHFESQSEAEALCQSLIKHHPEAVAFAESHFIDFGPVGDGPDRDEPEDDDYAAERQALNRAYGQTF